MIIKGTQLKSPPGYQIEMIVFQKLRYPYSVLFIIGNEFCERFSYYGMKSILSIYLKKKLKFSEVRILSTINLLLIHLHFRTKPPPSTTPSHVSATSLLFQEHGQLISFWESSRLLSTFPCFISLVTFSKQQQLCLIWELIPSEYSEFMLLKSIHSLN